MKSFHDEVHRKLAEQDKIEGFALSGSLGVSYAQENKIVLTEPCKTFTFAKYFNGLEALEGRYTLRIFSPDMALPDRYAS